MYILYCFPIHIVLFSRFFPAVPREQRTGFQKESPPVPRAAKEGDESGTGDGASTVRERAPRGRIWAQCLAHGLPSVLCCLILRRAGSQRAQPRGSAYVRGGRGGAWRGDMLCARSLVSASCWAPCTVSSSFCPSRPLSLGAQTQQRLGPPGPARAASAGRCCAATDPACQNATAQRASILQCAACRAPCSCLPRSGLGPSYAVAACEEGHLMAQAHGASGPGAEAGTAHTPLTHLQAIHGRWAIVHLRQARMQGTRTRTPGCSPGRIQRRTDSQQSGCTSCWMRNQA